MLRTMNKVLELRDQVIKKQHRIGENKMKLKVDQDLMKNYYNKIEQNCIQKQVHDLTDLMRSQKMKPIKDHLEQWKEKIGLKNSKSVYLMVNDEDDKYREL